MSLKEQMGECLRSKIVRIVILIFLLILIGVGAFLLLRSSKDSNNADEESLDFGPKLDGGKLVQFNPKNKESVAHVTKAIEEYLKPYNAITPNLHKDCNFYNPPPAGKTCDVDLKLFDPCTKEKNFGFNETRPCVFLKLTQKADWVPKFYNESKLPEHMPDELKTNIRSLVKGEIKNAHIVWVSCGGKSPEDEANVGPISYFPRQGFPGYFYPCTSQEGCTEPLLALQFYKPKVGVKINVQCKIWAENLDDSVDFELQIDS